MTFQGLLQWTNGTEHLNGCIDEASVTKVLQTTGNKYLHTA